MRRAARIVAFAFGIVIIVVLAAGAALVGLGNTGWGMRLLARETPFLTRGQLQVIGLSGRFPDRLRASRGAIRDRDGAWAAFQDAAVDWDPFALFDGDARIERLTAASLTVIRLPHLDKQRHAATWPARIDIDAWRIERFELGASLTSTPAALRVAGTAHLSGAGALSGKASAHRLDGAGDYEVDIAADAQGVTAHLAMREPASGLMANLAGTPSLGAIDLTASLEGPRQAERLHLSARAGPLRATANGTIDLRSDAADLDASLTAPAMRPRPDIGWQAIAATLKLHGEFTKPHLIADIRIDRPNLSGASAQSISLSAQGDEGAVRLTGTIAGLVTPGRSPDLFAAEPVRITAKARLDKMPRTFDIAVNHPLLVASAHATIAALDRIKGNGNLTVPSLAAFAPLTGLNLGGSGTLALRFDRSGTADRIAATGDLAVARGQKPLADLIGDHGKFDLIATLDGRNVDIEAAHFTGSAINATVVGGDHDGTLDLAWNGTLPNLSRLTPDARGHLAMKGRLTGAIGNLAVTASLHGAVGNDRVATGPITGTLEARGLPSAPEGKVIAEGRFAGSPLHIDVTARRDKDGTARITIAGAHWKGATAHGALAIPAGARWPEGKIGVRLSLADFATLMHQKLAGRIDAALDLDRHDGRPRLRVTAQGQGIAGADAKLAHATLDGTVDDALSAAPVAALHLDLHGIGLGRVAGDATVTARGPATALTLKWSSDWRDATAHGVTLQAGGAAVLDARKKILLLNSFEVAARGDTAHLLAPARIDFSRGLAIDRLRIGAREAVLQVAGRVAPQLDLTVSLRNVSPGLIQPFAPQVRGTGTLRLDATLKGSLAAPRGTVHVVGQRLALSSSAAAAFPAVGIDAFARLDGTMARLDARLTAGKSARLTATGTVPLTPAGAIDVGVRGTIDLAMLDPILAAAGRAVRGTLTIDGRVAGTPGAPRITGSATLAKGIVQDYARGLHITDINARVEAQGGTARLVDFTGHAGPGTLTARGTMDLTRATLPIDLTITARRARPLESDLLSADLDATLTLKGEVLNQLALGGTIRVRNADITIPDKFPATVAVLRVRRPGETPSPRRAKLALTNFNPRLAITLDAPEQVFVRGHGIDAELGGRITIGGSAEDPEITGALSLRRGTFDLVGQTLNFTSGTITFDEASLKGKIDPALNLVAQNSSGSVNATLTVTGYADAPVVSLTSVPQLPSDQIMAQLLFGQNVTQLSALQLASVAQGVASLGGIGGTGGTLSSIRKSLGLDRLSVGSDTKGTGAAIEAGRYVRRGVYVGAKQGISGGTQAQVQVDITKHLKAQTTIGAGNGTPVTGITPQNDPGSSVGLTYQFEY